MSLDEPFDLSADLPPPHDEEPASLRQDILDELADHLACALRRETMIHSDVSQAQTNVLQRFGDPAKVARKLWWDAMWEKIMMQRITLAASILSVIIVIGVGVVVARTTESVKDSQQFLLSQQKLFNDSVLEQLKTVTQPNVVQNEWVPLEIILRDESDRPVKGRVTIKTTDQTPPHPKINLNVKTNDQGIASLGQIPWGNYEFGVVLDDLSIQTTWKELIRPGTVPDMKIICPVSVPEPTFEAKFAPPEDLISPQRFYLVDVHQQLQSHGRDWNIRPQATKTVILDSQGRYLGQVEFGQALRKSFDNSSRTRFGNSLPTIPQSVYSPRMGPIFQAFENSGIALTAENMFGLQQREKNPFGRGDGHYEVMLHSFHTGAMKLRGNRFQVTLTSVCNGRRLREDEVPKELTHSDPTQAFLVSLPLSVHSAVRAFYSLGLETEDRFQLKINSTDPVWGEFRVEAQEYAKLFDETFEKAGTISRTEDIPASEGTIRPR